ncbi:MAG: NADP-dependent phosphogluconate dehydrogenase [Bacteroidota bacterium]
MNPTFDFGMIGLGVMGRNFLLNIADSGFSVIGLDRDAEKAQSLEQEGGSKRIAGTTDTADFVARLKTPRKIMLLVPAGKIVDAVIESLLPHLDKGDLIIDGGNSFFEDTQRRVDYLAEKDIHFLGTGVSGGAEGARRGPSIMPGGAKEAYALVQKEFEAAAAKVQGEPCVTWVGKGAAGHYVKMVHNGIEYALMQLIAEAYDLLKTAGGFTNPQMAELFSLWNEGRLSSFLIEITADILAKADDQGEGWLIDKILDKAKQKGTGKWTSQNAMDLGIPVPTIDAAVTMRGISALKAERVAAMEVYPRLTSGQVVEPEIFAREVEGALYFSFVAAYAQGLSLLRDASKEYGFELDLTAIARIWRGGCIIRADLLEDIRAAYAAHPSLANLVLAPSLQEDMVQTRVSIQTVQKVAASLDIPILAFSSALHYFDAYRSAHLPLNVVQAQRDYFGSHTYERNDQEGIFHTEW